MGMRCNDGIECKFIRYLLYITLTIYNVHIDILQLSFGMYEFTHIYSLQTYKCITYCFVYMLGRYSYIGICVQEIRACAFFYCFLRHIVEIESAAFYIVLVRMACI